MPKKESCKNCKFWMQVSCDEKRGQCHRYPPQPDGKAGIIDYTSQTLAIWWCGEFKRK